MQVNRLAVRPQQPSESHLAQRERPSVSSLESDALAAPKVQAAPAMKKRQHKLGKPLSMANTIEAYHETELEGEDQNDDWIYGNIRSDQNTEITIASSRIASSHIASSHIASPCLPPATELISVPSPSPSLDLIQALDEDDIVDRLLYLSDN
ncbi:hypothetical protein BGX27_004539 [Mortierella sp. AM989]|nr:hypothetical protein BGX27_004539 [Mortierella sp. AM989]